MLILHVCLKKKSDKIKLEICLEKVNYSSLSMDYIFIFNYFSSCRMNFFSVCSLVGLLILVPVNYASQESSDKARISHSLDSFSISKVERGSNWYDIF